MKSRHRVPRIATQLLFLLLVLYISVGHYLSEKGIAELPGTTSLHAVCPFGGVVTLYNLVSDGTYVQKIHPSNLFVLGGLLISLVIAGAFFCGWICPLGSVQEWIGKAGRKLLRSHYNKVPAGLNKILSLGKYAMLIFVIVQTARIGTLSFSSFDPYYNLFNIWTDEIALSGYIAVFLTLGASLFIERPFCRYACPLGAINGLFNRFSIFRIRRQSSTCIDCGLCDKVCPAGINVSKVSSVNSPACNRCMKCVDICPANSNSTLTIGFGLSEKSSKASKTISVKTYIILALSAFLVPVGLSVLTGKFETEKTRVYIVPDDIKGSTSFEEIVENYPISKEQLFNGLGIPEMVSVELKVKDLTGILGFIGEEEVISREHLSALIGKLGEPISSLAEHSKVDFENIIEFVQSSGLDESTVVSEVMASGPPGLFTYLFSGRWPFETSGDGAVIEEKETGSENHGQSASVDIKGSTSLLEIERMVPDFEAFLEYFGLPIDEPKSSLLKDLKTKYQIEISDIKDYVSNNQ